MGLQAAKPVAILIALSVISSPGDARADVLEIDDGGTVIVRAASSTLKTTRHAARSNPIEDIALPSLPVPQIYAAAIARLAARYDLAPDLLAALVWQESRWRHQAVSSKGALGLAQLMPGTAASLGVDPRDPVANLEGGAKYLRHLLDRFDGNVEQALAAYNAGPGRVARAGGVPHIRETQDYVTSIVDRMSTLVSKGSTR